MQKSAFLHADALSPSPSAAFNNGLEIGRWCATNGLIIIKVFSKTDGRLGERSISVVSLIENHSTGERHRHERQLELFKFLKKRIRRKLTHASRPILVNGSIGEEDRSVRMTDAAVELARAEQVAAVPGRRLKKSQ